jgi:hypothetical protein
MVEPLTNLGLVTSSADRIGVTLGTRLFAEDVPRGRPPRHEWNIASGTQFWLRGRGCSLGAVMTELVPLGDADVMVIGT